MNTIVVPFVPRSIEMLHGGKHTKLADLVDDPIESLIGLLGTWHQ
jgi:hypothetical protein